MRFQSETAHLNLYIWLRKTAMVDTPQMVKGDHSLAARSLQIESGKQEGADGQKHTCTLTLRHTQAHTNVLLTYG